MYFFVLYEYDLKSLLGINVGIYCIVSISMVPITVILLGIGLAYDPCLKQAEKMCD